MGSPEGRVSNKTTPDAVRGRTANCDRRKRLKMRETGNRPVFQASPVSASQ